MNLTLFTDYALRILIHLGSHPGETIPASAVSDAFGISVDHTAKAAKWLTQQGYVTASRGKLGGLVLARAPETIRLGAFVRASEPHQALLECFDARRNACVLSPACRLKRVLFEAEQRFFAVLDDYTLADVLQNAPELAQLLSPTSLSRRSR